MPYTPFKAGGRYLFRNKTYTFLNIAGLAVGIGACLLIFLLLRFELSFDNFHPGADRIYRLVSVPYREGSPLGAGPGAPLPLAQAVRADLPMVERVAAIFGRDVQVTIAGGPGGAGWVSGTGAVGGNKRFKEAGDVYFAEPAFFDIFHFDWLSGDAKTLGLPGSAVLTRETASRFFGDWRMAIGRTIQVNNKDLYRVTGILKDMPANTDFPLGVVLSYSSLQNVDPTDWQGIYGRGYTFVREAPGVSLPDLDRQLRNLVERGTPPGRERRGVVAQPLAEMHRDERYGTFNGRTFSSSLSRSLMLIAVFLLIIACVNYVNLATAQAVTRSRETGIRKVLGSGRARLVWKFVGEAAWVTVMAVALAAALAVAGLPFLNNLLGTRLALRLTDPGVWLLLGSVGVVATLLSGLYPAIVLSRFKPIQTLKNSLTVRMAGGIRLRRGLVGLQFSIAQVLIVCVLVVSSQMNFFRHAPLGFDASSIVNVPIPGDSVSVRKMEVVRRQLLAMPGVEGVSFSTFSPLDNDIWSNQFKFDHSLTKTDFQAYFKWADADFFSTYRPELVAGRAYGPSDTLREYVVNETLVHKLGFHEPKDILGKEINIWDQLKGPVVGVVKDFHTNSMQKPITPIVMGCWKDSYGMAGIRLRAGGEKAGEGSTEGEGSAGGGQAGNMAATLAGIEKIWNTAYPNDVYSFAFLDDKIVGYYKEEGKVSLLYRLFAAMAILISCLGLYGLVSFMAVQRMKEIGVRKVLGASVLDVLLLLSGEMAVLLAGAFAVAAPVGYLLMHRWLEGFAYRITPGVGMFFGALAVSVVIALGTVGHRAFRAATANPARVLRSE